MTGYVDARGWVTTLVYDALNRAQNVAYADGNRVTSLYDAVGQLQVQSNATVTMTYQYDAAGRRTAVSHDIGEVFGEGPLPVVTLSYSYDAQGNRLSVNYPWLDNSVILATSYTYDARNAVVGILNPWNQRTTFSYDALGQPLRQEMGNGVATT